MRLLFGVSKGSWRHTRTILLRAGEDAAVDYLEGCIHVCLMKIPLGGISVLPVIYAAAS